MNKRTTVMRRTLVLAALLASPLAAQEEIGERAVERRRIVVNVEKEPGQVYKWKYVMGDEGEPLVMRTLMVDRGFLGVELLDLTPELRRHFGAPEDAGVMISRVEAESPAAAAGLLPADVIVEIDGRQIRSARQAGAVLGACQEGHRAKLRVVRDGADRTLTATLTERPRRQLDLGDLVRPGGEGPPLTGEAVVLDAGTVDEALLALRQRLESPEWDARLRQMAEQRRGLEERILELEERLRQLERQLAELPR